MQSQCIHAFASLDSFCFVPPDIQQVTPQLASPSPISAPEHTGTYIIACDTPCHGG